MASVRTSVNGPGDPVAKLAKFLQRTESDVKILTGKSKLSLTTAYLAILNRCFATTHPRDPATTVSEEGKRYDAQSVQFLRDFLHRAIALKLIQENATVQGPVDVSRFHALTVLEVKRVPIHFLVGLSSLRSQLRVLICSRCVHSLQMLLTGCGGDKAEEQDWPVLHTLNLSHNYIDALDESLCFLPALKALDLSHNNIRHTRDYLECLTEISYLNLSFNQLVRVPSLVHSHVKSLLLRGNNVESLSGVECLEELGTLDLAKNAIFDTTELFSLGYLHSVRNLHFHGNPFTYEGKWRMVISHYLAPEAAQTMTFIDDIPLSKAEVQVVPKKGIRKPYHLEATDDPFTASFRSSDVSVDNLEESVDINSGERRKRTRGKKSTARVRHASISEQSDDPGRREKPRDERDVAKVSAASKSKTGTDAKKEFENMRQMHGTGWLLALQNPYENVTRSKPEDKSQDVHIETAADTAGSNVDTDSQEILAPQTVVIADVHVQPVENEDGGGAVQEEVIGKVTIPEEEVIAKVTTPEEMGPVEVPSRRPEDGRAPLEKQSSEQLDLLMKQDSEIHTRIYECEEKNDEEEDVPDLCGPLLIRLLGTDPPTQLFVTVKETYIEERDLFGKIAERLETKSLKGMTVTIESMPDELNNMRVDLPVVKLSFDYIKKDRQKRAYIMEDINSCETLTQVLEPFLLTNQAKKTRIFMQCLKCMLEFPRDQARKKVEKKARKSHGQMSEEESGSDFESVNEVLACPSCDSTLLVEVDDPRSSEPNTPYGSVASVGSVDFAAKPVATSSPWKPSEKQSVIVTPSNIANLGQAIRDFFTDSISSESSTQNKTASTGSTVVTATDATLKSDGGISGGETSVNLSASQSVGSDFKLPDPSIKMEISVHTPVEELANYPPEKLRELLTADQSGFKQRYSLCPTDVHETPRRKTSGPPTPLSSDGETETRRKDASKTNGFPGNNSVEKMAIGKTLSSQSTERTPSKPKDEDSIDNLHPTHPYSEDDIVVLGGPEAASHHSTDYVDTFHLRDDHSDKDAASVDAVSSGRLDSYGSDIAVISENDAQSNGGGFNHRNSNTSNLSIVSDGVFEVVHQGLVATDGGAVKGHRRNTSDERKDFLASNEHDVIYRSHSGCSDDVANLNSSGHFESGELANSLVGGKNGVATASPSHSLNSDSVLGSSVTEPSMLSMAEQDCCNVHHRLKLYFSMSVFGDEEDFTCLLRGKIFQFSKKVKFEGLLVVSTRNLYIMKITKEESEVPSDWLLKRTEHSLRDLTRLHVGIGSQSIQLEFSSDGVLYTVVTGDKSRTKQFVGVMSEAISKGTWKKKFKGVVWDHPQTFLNLTSEVFVPEATGDTSYEVDPQINVYVTALLRTATETKQSVSVKSEPVCILVTATDIYLVEENHFFPLALNRNKKVKGQQQFTPQGHRKISDISELELYADSDTDVTVSFFSEDTGEETQWNITTLSEPSLTRLLSAIKEPWREMFGVNIQETVHPSITIQEVP